MPAWSSTYDPQHGWWHVHCAGVEAVNLSTGMPTPAQWTYHRQCRHTADIEPRFLVMRQHTCPDFSLHAQAYLHRPSRVNRHVFLHAHLLTCRCTKHISVHMSCAHMDTHVYTPVYPHVYTHVYTHAYKLQQTRICTRVYTNGQCKTP